MLNKRSIAAVPRYDAMVTSAEQRYGAHQRRQAEQVGGDLPGRSTHDAQHEQQDADDSTGRTASSRDPAAAERSCGSRMQPLRARDQTTKLRSGSTTQR